MKSYSKIKEMRFFQKTWFLLHRKFIWLLCLVLLIPGIVSAQKEPKILLINSDVSVEKYKETQEAFKQAIPYPVSEVNLGDKRELSEIEERLWDEDPDLIYCIGTKAYLIANKHASDKDIVFSSIINWRRLPITEKTYGVSNELHAGMEIMLLRSIFPEVRKIGVLYSKKYTEEWYKNAKKDVGEMGVELVGQNISKKKQTISTLKKLLSKVDMFWLISDPELISDKEALLDILRTCDDQKIPVFSYHEAFAKIGAVLVAFADNHTIGGQAANIAMEVLSGNKLDANVQFPAGTYTILNLKKVKEYGLEYSEDALGWVNEIIQ